LQRSFSIEEITSMSYLKPKAAESARALRRSRRNAMRPSPARPAPGQFWSVIPAGGSGTRLWPVSRSGQPKFLLPLVNAESSLLQDTVDRLRPVCDSSRMLVVGGPAHAVPIARQLPEFGTHQIVVEPSPKGSGPAIALAAAIIARQDPQAIMGSFAADHDVRDGIAFTNAVRGAIATARDGWLVTIGIQPTRPETGYGYIERDDAILMMTPGGDAHRAARFIEKPDLAHATAFLETGRFLWNASMFIWRVDVFMEELRAFLPEVADGVTRIAEAWGTTEQDAVMGEIWPRLPDVTIDNGVMELSSRVAVVPAEMGWSDVGDWHGLGTLLAQDERGNSVRGDIISTDCSNSVIWSDTGRIISLLGLDNIVVVDTPDALLVADRSQAQLVRATVNRLKELNRTNVL
jgi:mannose-1-phosphate guanylyltransferase